MKVYENIWKKGTSKNGNLVTHKYVVYVFLFQPSKREQLVWTPGTAEAS